jgi:glycerol-3-phosphate acyltransferase PlsY
MFCCGHCIHQPVIVGREIAMHIEQIVLTFWIAYLIGSIPVAYLVARSRGVNIFTIGSGNMGAANVARAVGGRWGILTWGLDSVKGAITIYLVRQMNPDHTAMATMVGAIGVIVGHNWSVVVMIITGRLRGGKGAAAAIGTWLVFLPLWLVVAAFFTWVGILILTRFVSLAVLTTTGLVSLGLIALVVFGYYDPIYISYLIVTAMIFFRHRENIQRLIAGNERRFGQSAVP